MPSRSAAQTTTPLRPSISPLSTASKSLKSSPIATRDAAMKENAAQNHDEEGDSSDASDAEVGEHHDDRSSSLSDPEDDNEEAEDGDEVEDDALNGEDTPAQQLVEDDSEAETERLEQTPQKLRKQPDGVGKTPSKLNQASTADDELSEPGSPLATGAGAASSTSTVATADSGQKRKRSETADSSLTSAESDLGESPRKKAHEMPEHAVEDGEEALEHAEPSTESTERAEETPVAEEPRATPTTRGRGGYRGGKRGGRKKQIARDIAQEQDPQTTEETAEPEEEPSEEKVAKTEEEIKAKNEASSIYNDVTKQFRSFREKLTNERIATLDEELKLMEKSAHPEYLKQVECVDARLQKQRSEARAFYNYKQKSIRERTLGERSQLHSQYYQSVRELREDVLYKLGEDWYAIQKERRQSHQEKDDAFIYKFPTNKKVQHTNQAKYNHEVSVLSGMAKWVGFPAAPELNGIEGGGFEEDMKAMKLFKRHSTSNAVQKGPRPPFHYSGPAVTAVEQNERLAHERFMEQNAWARPQASIHPHATPAISHTPEWAEPSTGGHSTAKHLIRNLSNLQRTGSPYATPLTQKRQLGELGGVHSDGIEAPSSVLAAPPTSNRMEVGQGSSNQTSPITFPKQRQNGTELTGFRNISNISGISGVSGASTIDAPQDQNQYEYRPREPQPQPQHQDPTTAATERRTEGRKPLPELTHVSSASHTIFDTSQLHRHGDERREVYQNVGFRPQEGAFGTPAPLSGPGGS